MSFVTPVVFIGLVIVVWLSLRSVLPQFSVSSASISAFNLSSTTLSPFSQGSSIETSISARLASFSNYINDDTAALGLEKEKDCVRGSIEFGVRLFSRVRFREGCKPTRPYHIRVWCPPVPFGFSSPPQGDGSLRECEVHM